MRKQISGGYHTCHYRVLVVPFLTVEKSGFMIKTLDPCYEVPGKKHLYISISIYPPSLTRCPNHLSWIHLTSKRSSSAPSSHQIAELLTLMLTIATIYSFSHLDLVTIDEGFNRHGFTSKALPFGSALFLRWQHNTMCAMFVVGKRMYTEWTTGNISEANVTGEVNLVTLLQIL